jgi:hypothetical protein
MGKRCSSISWWDVRDIDVLSRADLSPDRVVRATIFSQERREITLHLRSLTDATAEIHDSIADEL